MARRLAPQPSRCSWPAEGLARTTSPPHRFSPGPTSAPRATVSTLCWRCWPERPARASPAASYTRLSTPFAQRAAQSSQSSTLDALSATSSELSPADSENAYTARPPRKIASDLSRRRSLVRLPSLSRERSHQRVLDRKDVEGLLAAALAAIFMPGAVLRPTLDSGAHAAGRSGGKGGSSPRDAGRMLPFPAGRRERESRCRRHERSTR